MEASTSQPNALREKLRAGGPTIGMWSILPSADLCEVFGLAGLDFLILDMEHGAYDPSTLLSCVRACEATGCSPLVRVPGIDPPVIQGVLDLGVHGLIVPQVSDASAAQQALACMKFSPEGIRGYNPFTRAALYARPATNISGKLNNAYALKAIIVENKSAVEDLDDILQIEDLDIVYIGVYDLSVALGHAGNTSHPEVQTLLENSVRKIRDKGKAAGMMVLSPGDIQRAISLGGNFLVYSVDGYFVRQAAASVVDALRSVMSKV